MPRPEVAPEPLRHFGDARSRSVWRWQLMLAAATVTIAAVAALLTPDLFVNWTFAAGVILIVAITLVALTVPWHRASATQIVSLPFADIIAIAMLDAGTEAPLAQLWVFPIAWIATYYSVGMTVGALSLVGALMLVNDLQDGTDARETVSLLIRFIAIVFIAVVMSVGGNRNRSSKRLLRAQTARMGNALERIGDQQARNRRLLDTLRTGIARVGSEGILEVANSAFQQLYALDESTLFRHAYATEYTSRRGAPVPWSETTINRAARGELFTDEIVWLFGIDGKWRALKATARHTEAVEGGRSDGLALIVRDVTGEIDPGAHHEAAMRSISHELRNPLTAVLGHVDLVLDRKDLSEEARAQLEIVSRASERMQTLIDGALASDGPRHDDSDIAYDLAEVSAASVEAFAPAAHARGIVLEAELDRPLPLCGDAFRVRQVVDNVISNAIKYSPRGGRVTVTGRPLDDGTVTLEIADTGFGISDDDLPHIFEPDFRTQVARDSGSPGTGLGLGISRGIVHDHGGRMLVRSQLGNGTAVTIVLPETPEKRQREAPS